MAVPLMAAPSSNGSVTTTASRYCRLPYPSPSGSLRRQQSVRLSFAPPVRVRALWRTGSWQLSSCGLVFDCLACRVVRGRTFCELGIELIQMRRRLAESIQSIELAADLL